jgi:very-short-patch-repair endonuclease/DNA modification methylase
MTSRFDKLVALLRELFQLDQPDLDFGIYRILRARDTEVTQFLKHDLLPQVKAAFAEYRTADKAAIEQELAKASEQARSLGADPETLPKVKELRERLARESVDLEALEADVYDHLYRFFRRYYHEGDFLSRRVYKEGVYAIPYEGEEVKLYWANHDQYYVKTSESFRDYAFRLRPEDAQNPMRVHFRLVDAAEGEHNNVRETNGKERRFRLAPAPFAALENGELVIRFTFAPDPQGRKQKDLNAEAEAAILSLPDPALTDWIGLLSTKHVRTDGTLSESTRLRVHLDRYTARNTFDYFIHKDLGGFLRRELDFYIKNEVMHLDDIESETAPRVEQYLAKIKVIRRIAHKIIDFLAQIEDFQKKLWLKKKFVVETQYCVTLGRILAIEDGPTRDWLIAQILRNDAQREEWERLYALPSPLWGEGQGEGEREAALHPSRTREERNMLLTQFAREMRHAPTDAEKRLWYFLRDRRLLGWKFRRQHQMGPYIFDFVCIEGRLAVEVDGGQHADLFQQVRDQEKSQFLQERGFRLLRFWNDDVLKNTTSVLQRILEALEERPLLSAPHPNPLPEGEREGEVLGFLQGHPTLMVDTRHFDEAFKARLLAAIPDIDEETDGLLIHSENFQALNLLQARYRGQIDCVHIDPPYNTATSRFPYKNDYQHSSWLAMMYDRLASGWRLLTDEGHLLCHIDENEQERLHVLCDELQLPSAGTIVWDKKNPMLGRKGVATQHEYILWRTRSDGTVYMRNVNQRLILGKAQEIINKYKGVTEEARQEFARWIAECPGLSGGERAYKFLDDDGRVYQSASLAAPEPRTDQKFFVPLVHPVTRKPCPVPANGWSRAPETMQQLLASNAIIFGADETIQPRRKIFLTEETQRQVSSVIQDAGRGKSDVDQLGINFPYCHPVSLYVHLIGSASPGVNSIVLDFFAGSGTTGHAVINLNREDGGRRKFILVEMGDYFDTVLVPRLKKVTFSPEWKDGKPLTLPLSPEGRGNKGEGWVERSPRILKILRLESYEDTLNNLELRRTEQQQRLLELPEAQGPDRLREQYILRYMLDVEARGSQSLLNIAAFTDPTAYTLTVKRPGSDESREVNVDLLETFNYLIGLRVQQVDAPQCFRAETERDREGRLRLKGLLKPVAPHPNPLPEGPVAPHPNPLPEGEREKKVWWFRTVTGTMPDGRKTLVIWRNRPGGDAPGGIEQDNLILDEWFKKQGYSSKDREFDLIYVNGDNNLENLKAPDDTWKVRLIEEEFLRRMFAEEGV